MKTLKNTINDMLSSDYKVRLVAEREQLLIRLKSLENYLSKINPQTDAFDLAWYQRRAMIDYLDAIEKRMNYLKIDLTDIE